MLPAYAQWMDDGLVVPIEMAAVNGFPFHGRRFCPYAIWAVVPNLLGYLASTNITNGGNP